LLDIDHWLCCDMGRLSCLGIDKPSRLSGNGGVVVLDGACLILGVRSGITNAEKSLGCTGRSSLLCSDFTVSDSRSSSLAITPESMNGRRFSSAKLNRIASSMSTMGEEGAVGAVCLSSLGLSSGSGSEEGNSLLRGMEAVVAVSVLVSEAFVEDEPGRRGLLLYSSSPFKLIRTLRPPRIGGGIASSESLLDIDDSEELCPWSGV